MLSSKVAAEAVGMSKQGLLKAVRQGKLSASKDANGEWQIDPAELFRVYPPAPTPLLSPLPDPQAAARIERLEAELQQMQERLNDKDELVRNLWRQLDSEAEERRRLTLLLTGPPPDPPPPKKNFWQRLFGGP